MRPISSGALAAAVLASSVLVGAMPAAGLELFGIRLWGRGDEDEERVEIIDPLPYQVTIRAPEEPADIPALIEQSSSLWLDREEPASGKAGLLAKAKGDYRRILATLYNSGYYGPEISIRVAGQEAADLSLDADLPADVPIVIEVDPGPRFRFGVTEIVNAPPFVTTGRDPVETPAQAGFARGEIARAGAVGRASELAVEQWRARGHAKAAETEREVVADHSTSRLNVRIGIAPGPLVHYGPVTVEGRSAVNRNFIAFMTDLPMGKRFDPEDLEDAQTRLNRLATFRLIRIEEGEVAPDRSMPMTVRVDDRPKRSFGVGASYSTLDGLGLEGYWLHRNLFGRAEKLRFDAAIQGLGATDVTDLTYSLGVSFIRPGVFTPDTDFFTSLTALRATYDTYREQSLTAQIGFSQVFGRRLTGDLFLEAQKSRIEDDLGTRDFLTFGPVARGTYDRRNDPLEPTGGYYLAAEVRPFYEAEFGNMGVYGTLEGRAYRALDAEKRFVLAARVKTGSMVGAPFDEMPPSYLFYAGGGGSVRGYPYQSIGVDIVEDGEDIVVGGRSLIETSGEIRARVTDRFGVVGFADAGYVSLDSVPGSDGGWHIGTGLGLRYYTGIGALRLDVATPIDPRPDDDAVALYIGIGQAF